MDLHFVFKRQDDIERRLKLLEAKQRRLIEPTGAHEVQLTGLHGIEDLNSVEEKISTTALWCHALSVAKDPPIDCIVKLGAVPHLVQFLSSHSSELQFYAAWALTNITSTTKNITLVMDNVAVPPLVELLTSHSDRVREMAAWALGNIAGDSAECRDIVQRQGAFIPVLKPLCRNDPYEIDQLSWKQKASFTLRNLCRGKPRPAFHQMEQALRALKSLLQNFRDEEILTNACWAVSYMLEGTEAEYKAVAEHDLQLDFIKLLKSNHTQPLIFAALHALGNMMLCDTDEISSSPCHTQMRRFIHLEGLRYVHSLLKLVECSLKNKIEACWIISRFTASSRDMIQAVIDENIVQTLVRLLESKEVLAVRRKAVLALKFVALGGDYEQIGHLFMNGCVKALTDMMRGPDEQILLDSGIGLFHMLNSNISLFKQEFKAAEGPTKIEGLMKHKKNGRIREVANMIHEIYNEEEFEPSYDDDDEVMK